MKKRNTAQKIIIAVVLCMSSICSMVAQINMTKVKDASVSGTPTTPVPGSILELESINKGFLTPRMTTAQRDAIAAPNLVDGLLIYNTTTGCFNYYSLIQTIWLSLCGTPPPAIFTISPAQCSALVVGGTYTQGVTLGAGNFLSVPVTVSQAGDYTISATTNNGYYFEKSGNFPATGNYTLNLPGTGTPNNAAENPDEDPVTISLNGIESTCIPEIHVIAAEVEYAITNCGFITPQGSYFIGIPLTPSNTLPLVVNVVAPGFWSITTNTVNGYSFAGTGTFTSSGPNQNIELIGTGTPTASGTNSFNILTNSENPVPCSDVEVVVSNVAYTMDCATAVVNGSYMEAVALTGTNTITLPVNVTATGQTTISTNTVNGISFTSGVISLSSLGIQNVVLTGAGTPTTSGNLQFTVSGTPGAAATCTVDVSITPQPLAYTMTCGSLSTSGIYAEGVLMTGSHTMTVPVNVSFVGDYEITTNTENGISFSGSGTFVATGLQNVVLTATGTATSNGTFAYTLTSNSSSGIKTCNKNITFIFRTMNVLGLGTGMYQPATAGAAPARSILTAGANFSPTGTVPVQSLNIVDGAVLKGNALKSSINTNAIDIIVVGYYYDVDAATVAVLKSFVDNKKGAVIYSGKEYPASDKVLIEAIGGGTVTLATTGFLYVSPTLNVNDPVLNGPFGDVRNRLMGIDWGNAYYVSGLPATYTVLSTHNSNPSQAHTFKHNTLGFMYVGDTGWLAGNNANLTTYPNKVTGSGVPETKAYSGGTIYNSFIYANAIAWAIKYAQINTVTSYVLP